MLELAKGPSMKKALSQFLLGVSLLAFWSFSGACENKIPHEKPAAAAESQSAATEDLLQQHAIPQTEAESFVGPTCNELGIPSWDRRVGRLAQDLCARCHNDRFAWNGARLDTYDEFYLNSAGAIERIRTRDLTITINVLEAAAFIDWYEAGMPKTEQGCAEQGTSLR